MLDHMALDDEYERHAMKRRDHFERMKIRELRLTFNVLRRSADGAPGWTSVLKARDFAQVDVTRERVEKMIAARDVVAGGPEALMAARLRVPEGVTFAQSGEDQVKASFEPDLMVEPLAMTQATMGIVGAVHDAPTVREGIAAFAAEGGVDAASVADRALGAVRGALLYGLLEVG
jgi:hypothetical protein